MIERHIENPIDDQEYNAVYRDTREAAGDPDQACDGNLMYHAGMAAYRVITLTPKISYVINAVPTTFHASKSADRQAEDKAQTELLRDIFGKPFRPVTLNSSWLTSTVATLARQMYDNRDFSAMLILADALQDAGCENAAILDHCRSGSGHVRGCFVVDRLLDKK